MTTTIERQYDDLVRLMRSEPMDFIGTDYAIDARHAEKTILPLAQDRGIAVLAYAPFGRTRLWPRVKGRQVPDWAGEFDAELLGAVLPQVRGEPSGGDGDHAGDEPTGEHDRQHGRRDGPAAGRGSAPTDGRAGRGAAPA